MIASAAAAVAAALALQGAPLAAADATAAQSPIPVATGNVCSSGGNVIGLTLDSSGSISSVDFEEAREQVRIYFYHVIKIKTFLHFPGFASPSSSNSPCR